MAGVDEAVAAIRAGTPVILPTDTVYGLCAGASDERAARTLYELKRRPATPIAILCASRDQLFDALPELPDGARATAGALLPGPYTLVVPNPVRRYRWLTAATPGTIGVRVPELALAVRTIVEQAGPLAATSANRHGARDPRRLDEVPEAIRRACGAVVDGGELPGTPSTVIDVTLSEPRVLREGAVAAAEALARVRAAMR